MFVERDTMYIGETGCNLNDSYKVEEHKYMQ